MLSPVMLSVPIYLLFVIMLSVLMLNFVMLRVGILNVVAPFIKLNVVK
jgi:hypothetical protein